MTTSANDRGALWIVSSTALLGAAILYGARRFIKQRENQNPLVFCGRRPSVGTILGTVDEIHVYPVKSMKGCSVEHCAVTAAGLEGDRILILVNDKGIVVTQRMVPTLSQIQTTYKKQNIDQECATITLSLDKISKQTIAHEASTRGMEPLQLSLSSHLVETLQAREIQMGSTKIRCLDLGDAASFWIQEALALLVGASSRYYNKKNFHLRLVWCPQDQQRFVTKTTGGLFTENATHFDATHLSDLAPISLASKTSLNKLNRTIQRHHDSKGIIEKTKTDFAIDRFRANLVVSMKEYDWAFLEDHVLTFQIGDAMVFRNIGPTARCVMPTIDQTTSHAGFRENGGIRQAEPLATLAQFRSGGLRFGLPGLVMSPEKGGLHTCSPMFGVYLGVESAESKGTIRVGDSIRILEYKSADSGSWLMVLSALLSRLLPLSND